MARIALALLAGSAIWCGTAPAGAQEHAPLPAAPPLYDPRQLPVYKGRLEVFTLTPRGDIDGFVLADGTEVKTPPHLSAVLAESVRPGDLVTVHGLKAAALPLVAASSVSDDASGRTVIDAGRPPLGSSSPGAPPAAELPGQESSVVALQGRIRLVLHGPRGDVNGALLENGTVLRLPPPEAVRLAALLQPGRTIAIAGIARTGPNGSLVEATGLGASPDRLSPVAQGGADRDRPPS